MKSSSKRKRMYQLIVDLTARGITEDSVKLAKKMERRLKRDGRECHLHQAQSWDEFGKQVAGAVRQRPFALVIFGGDSSVRLAASRAVKSRILLGIVPCGRYNSIFRSIYGHNEPEEALGIIKSEYQTRIDAGLANGHFFLGSLVCGLVPAMIERLGDKKLPRLAMTWSKLATHAADDSTPRDTIMKVDSYTFTAQPLILNIHLLPYFMTLHFAPVASTDDGRLILIYDQDGNRENAAHYIRDLHKNKYQYSNSIQMIRGQKIHIAPAAGRKWLLDTDEVEFSGNEIAVEVLHRALRVFSHAPENK
ncbi:MAG: hypothetical protein GY841_05010 [FCB group bacterium]|nr:hypothetical protein [FCB group bacterium]